MNWFSTYQSHHRVTNHFGKGRVFISGDAAHIHSPAGGQGMNTGIGDAINLAWKLASVLKKKSDPSLLNSYEIERLPFAKLLVSTTDNVFKNIISKNMGGKIMRNILFPYTLPLLLRFSTFRKTVFKLVSQTRIHYRDSFLSRGKAGKIQGGDRLPWLHYEEQDNFTLLKSLNWQIHAYGQPSAELQAYATSVSIPLHSFAWNRHADSIGFSQDVNVLKRYCNKILHSLSNSLPPANNNAPT